VTGQHPPRSVANTPGRAARHRRDKPVHREAFRDAAGWHTRGVMETTATESVTYLNGVACPAANQCTSVDFTGREVTFNPVTQASSPPAAIDSSSTLLSGVACPLTSQCTAVDFAGRQVTFNPMAPGTPTPSTIDGNKALTGVACPAANQCTAVDAAGQQVTFNPTAPGTPTPSAIDGTHQLAGLACPSTSQCTAVDSTSGQQVTFNPTAPGTPTPTTIDSSSLIAVACPLTSQCTAVDRNGQAVTFNPASPGTPTPITIDSGFMIGNSTVSAALSGLACPSASRCIAVDFGGQVVEGDPTSAATWSGIVLPGANRLTAVACSSSAQCVTVDEVGQGFVGTAPVPSNAGPPTIAGTATQGQTLTETHGSWSNSPASFADQWEACDSSGGACSPIAGATGQTYVLGAADVGHTLRVQETASNANGSSSPASSVQSAVVLPLAPSNVGLPTIAGTATQGQTLTETHGTWTGSPTGFTYQWKDCDNSGSACAAIAGAAGETYALTAADVGHTIRVQETAANAGGSSSPASSTQSGVVQAPPATATAPTDASLPTITGNATVGATLSTSTGMWTGTAPISYAYQWQRCNPGCTNIAGATGASYTLSTVDVGAQVRVVITATNSSGSAAAASASSTTVAAIAATAPTPAQITALLLTEITPTGKAAAIAALLKAGGDTISFKALSAGTALVYWYYVPAGAHIAKAKPKAQVVASGRLTFAAAGTAKLKIKLTAAGKTLLKREKSGHAKLLKLTAKATFTPAGRAAIVTTKTFTLHR
jgi:hypothetical protein